MKNSILLSAIFTLIVSLFLSCKKDENASGGCGETIFVRNGVLVLNEGAFGSSNASVTYFNFNDHKSTDDVFNKVNCRPLGDVAQSIARSGDNLYIVVNNSKKIEVVSFDFLKSKATITGFASPRYFLPVSADKAYVSDWSENNVKIVKISTYAIKGIIPTGNGPEQMLLTNNKVYVTNVGGFGNDSIVTIINAGADTVISTLMLSVNPNSIQLDKDGKIWVLCHGTIGPDFIGGTADDIGGKLLRVDPANDSIEAKFNFSQFEHPMKLQINTAKEDMFYLSGMSDYDGAVYKFNIYDASLPAAPLVDKTFYGLGIDHVQQNIYGAYSPAFNQAGYMFRYDATGILIDSVKVGIGPNAFFFNF